jgi:predicted oxidoreductase
MADVERMAEQMPWGTPAEVTERIIAIADAAGANMVQIGFNRGAMPHDMFIEQIRRFARDVLPALQAHEVRRVPAAEEMAA